MSITTEQREQIMNDVIWEQMIKNKNRIIELKKEEEILGEEYMEISKEYSGREKPHRIALSKCRGVQNQIMECEQNIIRLFMNYKIK